MLSQVDACNIGPVALVTALTKRDEEM